MSSARKEDAEDAGEGFLRPAVVDESFHQVHHGSFYLRIGAVGNFFFFFFILNSLISLIKKKQLLEWEA